MLGLILTTTEGSPPRPFNYNIVSKTFRFG